MKKLFVLGFVVALLCTGSCMHETKAEHQVQAEKAAPVLTAAEQQKKAQIEKALNGPHGAQIKTAVEKYSKEYKLDKNYVYAIAYTESSFNHRAVSPCGAKGTMQMLDSTFKARGGTNIWDIDQQIKYGCKHLAGLLAKYKGNVYLATSAYLMGGGAVDRYKGQTPPAAKHYVQRVFYHKAIIEGANI